MTLLEQLKHIHANGGGKNKNAGICDSLSDAAVDEFESVFIQWPKFSGNFAFPVPSGYERLSPGDAYLFAGVGEMWDREHAYGALRWELLEFAINKLEGM